MNTAEAPLKTAGAALKTAGATLKAAGAALKKTLQPLTWFFVLGAILALASRVALGLA